MQEACQEIVPQLAAVPVPLDGWQDRVLSILAGVDESIRRDVFWELDEHPGTYGLTCDGEEWHWKLRQVRNDPTFGPRLFALFPVRP